MTIQAAQAQTFPDPGAVRRLTPNSVLHVDPEPLLLLQLRLGPERARVQVTQLRAELASLLDRVAEDYGEGRIERLPDLAVCLAHLCSELGFPDAVNAARAVANCAEGEDAAALAATMDRLLRLGRAVNQEIAGLRLPGA